MKNRPKDEETLLASSASSSGSSRASSDIVVAHDLIETEENDKTFRSASSSPQPRRIVRFEVDEPVDSPGPGTANSQLDTDTRWTYDDDFLNSSDDEDFGRSGSGGSAPLLTGMTAPSVVVAGMDIGDLENPSSKSGMKMAFMNMANSIIGAGIIGQPYAFKQAGLATGIVLLVVLTIVVDWTINLIVINSKLSGANSFQSTVSACFGKWGLISISLAQWAFAFGGMIAFCIIIGDTIPHVLSALFPSLKTMPLLWLLTNRRAVIVLCVVGISYPLSLYRDIAKLAKASALALVSMLVIISTAIIQGFLVAKELKGSFPRPLLTLNSGVFQAIGVISFAFVCHHNSLLIYGSLRKPTLDRFARVTHYSTGISMVACMAMALAGFLTFGDKTMGNVLNNFPSSNLMVNIARFCFGLNMLTTLPLEAFVCREVMLNYWYPSAPFDIWRHVGFTTGLVFSALFFSLLTCDLGSVFELIGATSACALAYILPPLCYIKLSTRSWKTILAWVCVCFGVTVLVISLVQAVVKIVSGSESTATCDW